MNYSNAFEKNKQKMYSVYFTICLTGNSKTVITGYCASHYTVIIILQI